MLFHPFLRLRSISPSIAFLVLFAGLACDKPAPQPADSANSENKTDNANHAAELAAGKLSGLYIRQQMQPMAIGGRMTFNLRREFFYFFPDGHLLYGFPSTGGLKQYPTAADYAAIKDVDPEHRGTYIVKGGQITFTPEKGTASTEPFSIPKAGDDSVLQIGEPSVVGSVKAMPFKEGQKLEGSYQFDGTVGLGTANTIFNVSTLTFHPDGTLGSDHLSGVDTKGVDTAVGNSGVTKGQQASSAGTYQFNGYILETTINGKTEKATAFRWAGDDKPTTPGLICIAGRVYSRQEAK